MICTWLRRGVLLDKYPETKINVAKAIASSLNLILLTIIIALDMKITQSQKKRSQNTKRLLL